MRPNIKVHCLINAQYFSRPTNHLVHDPNNSLIAGDVVELHRLRVSTIVHHVVASIVTPFGRPISDRPPIPTPDERLAKYKEHRFAKLHRRELRQKAMDGDASDEGGKINERAQKNKEKAMKMDMQAEKNLLEAKAVEKELRTEEELGARTIVPKQGPYVVVEERPQAGNSRGT
jgi:small subunit ribosomal protein S17